MKKRLAWAVNLVAASAFAAISAAADERDEKIQQLEKRLEMFEQRYRALEARLDKQEQASEKPKATPLVSVGASGFSMQSADTNFVFRFKGLLHIDSRSYVDDGGIKNNDTLLIRRARPIFEAVLYRDFEFRLQTDFGGPNAPTLRDAYGNYRYADEFQVRLGKFKTPVSLEQILSDSTLMFVERSLASDLSPSRDVGLQFHGKTLDGLINYAAGVFNGLGDGRASSNVDTDDEKSFAGRIFVFPWQRTGVKPLKKFGVGVGGSFGREEGAGSLPSGNGYDTEGQQQFFVYRTSTTAGNPNVVADGNHWRIAPQASWYYGPWRAMGEYVISSQDLRRSDTGLLHALKHRAWQVAAGYMLTGEEASERGVVPNRPFQPRENSWGAFEIVARLSSLDVDNDAFPLFADPTKSATEATAWAIGLNWYLNRNVRASANFNHTDFRGGQLGTVTAQDENVFFTRLQLAF